MDEGVRIFSHLLLRLLSVCQWDIAIRQRLSLIATLQSNLDLRSCTVERNIDLAFKPVSELSETPGELEDSGARNTAFTAYQAWIEQTLAEHGDLPPVEDKDADNSFAGLLRTIRREQQRIRDIKSRAWKKQMWAQFVAVEAELGEDVPRIAPPCTYAESAVDHSG